MLHRSRIQTRKIQKGKSRHHPEVDPIDLTSTPPPPPPTRIMEEEIPKPTNVVSPNPYKDIIPKTLKEKFDKDVAYNNLSTICPTYFAMPSK